MPTISLGINVEQTAYEAPTQWRLLGAEGKAEHVVTLCKNNSVVPSSVLEVGAGDGAILRCLGEQSFCKALHAVEISQSGVDVILNQRIPGLISCQTFDGYSLPFEDDSFDLVILSHVLEHIEYERALLREIRRVSKFQVIEIPMDFPALENKSFLMLGPSYGHINAHSPGSLRFLLSTENFNVLDHMLGQYSLALQEYDYFVNNSREKTVDAVRRFRTRFEEEKMVFETLPVAQKERRASFYAVLTRKESDQERMSRALEAVKSYIDSGQIQAARLIVGHYIPQANQIEANLDIARFCVDLRHWQAAQEFVERVIQADGNNADALCIKKLLETSSARTVRERFSAVSIRTNSAWEIAKQWIKMHAPSAVNVFRRLRLLRGPIL